MRSHCKRGHALDEGNTYRWTRGDGRACYRCRKCHAMRAKLKYRVDDAHREREKVRRLAAYRRSNQPPSTLLSPIQPQGDHHGQH